MAPERVVASFDPELDACEYGALILQRYAQTTAGEWNLAGILVTPIVEREEGWRQGMIIEYQGTTIPWSFLPTALDGKETHWELSFYESLERFVCEHLQGGFFQPHVSEEVLAYYLPVPAVRALADVEEELEEEYGMEGLSPLSRDCEGLMALCHK